MLNENYWKKKFSVGLALNTNVEEFRSCLDEFHPFIDNIYLSPPMGDRFHGREQIAGQMQSEKTVKLFWDLVELIGQYGISIEIVFNTDKLEKGDVENCRQLFDSHGISVDKVAVLDCIDWYYDCVKEYFPEARLIKSVNNMKNTAEGLLTYAHHYDEIVLGRHLIRSDKAAEAIRQMGSKCVLLLNNGCSFICGGCRGKEYCRESYEKALEKHSSEYLYALQSIMPYELHETYFPLEHIDYYKLSTRNGDTDYIRKTLDSYIHNNAEQYIREGNKNYFLWARLAWHIPHYAEFNYYRIQDWKKKICGVAER